MAVVWSTSGRPSSKHRVGGFLSAPAFARLSPDGRTLLIGATRFAGDGRFYLFTVPATGGPSRKISGEVLTERAAWSPDGSWIAAANYDGDVLIIKPDGSDQQTVVHLSGGSASNPLEGPNTVQIDHLAWSRDGDRIVFKAEKVPPET
jgi:Tol biopolymer transport system component